MVTRIQCCYCTHYMKLIVHNSSLHCDNLIGQILKQVYIILHADSQCTDMCVLFNGFDKEFGEYCLAFSSMFDIVSAKDVPFLQPQSSYMVHASWIYSTAQRLRYNPSQVLKSRPRLDTTHDWNTSRAKAGSYWSSHLRELTCRGYRW